MPNTKTSRLLTAGVLTATLSPLMAVAGEVSLTGQGSVSYTPDSARLQFTASAEHPLAEKASGQVTETMAQWRDAISDYRDQLQDYSDARVNLYTRQEPLRDKDQERETLAVASQTVSFTINDLELLNPLLEEAQSLGLQYHLGNGQFFHSNAEQMEQQALANAIADARQRCEFVAGQLDQTCGEVIRINIDGGFRPAPMMMAESRAKSDTVTSVGPREITASVNATFNLD
ncbi:SIMPL domain-containing protein [Marinobacter oulmenensis]|uniref:SIMPL domain-containing protein n=1 Tax=Marinobacter oulmenensis TaxID=643747 RepID=A0A840UD68_9GAMM|nr:SIMPL domain-containing protein [Marinobacter oulmenensis]MBB5321290.1 hypothetical protein [Marinobacter oulmenensis]